MSEPFVLKDNILHIENWENRSDGLVAGFTTRRGGFGSKPFDSWNMGLHVGDDPQVVVENRQHLTKQLQLPFGSFVAGEQVHSTVIKQVGRDDKGKGAKSYASSLPGIDGMFTTESGVLCTAFFADCVPLLFFDPVTGLIGIAHAGWKGTTGKIGEKMVEKMTDSGAKTSDLLAVIGPCISEEYYEVDEHVMQYVEDKDVSAVAKDLHNGHYLLNLKLLNKLILVHAGLPEKNIEVTNYCTYRDKNLFFSHRRDHGKTGRMLAFIGYRD